MKFYEIDEKGIILSNLANTSEDQRATSERTANTSEHQRKESNHSEHQRRPAKKSEQQRRPNYPNLHDESQMAIKMAKIQPTLSKCRHTNSILQFIHWFGQIGACFLKERVK
jgi:hypothetical protein